jgi:hypothetical protein
MSALATDRRRTLELVQRFELVIPLRDPERIGPGSAPPLSASPKLAQPS